MEVRTTNPALNDTAFERETRQARDAAPAGRMTVTGTVAKTGVLVVILVTVGAVCANQIWEFVGRPKSEWPGWVVGSLIAASLGGLVVAMTTVFAPRWAVVTGPLYAALEGWVLGGVSVMFEKEYAGIVLQAAALTVGVLVALLLAYATRLIRVTDNFRLGVIAATGGIALVYLASILLRMFGVNVPFLHDSGPIGIGISLVVVVVAALNLVLDFDFIERGAERRAPAYMEWYAGFGLLVTLVWLYLEILNLLAKLRDRK